MSSMRIAYVAYVSWTHYFLLEPASHCVLYSTLVFFSCNPSTLLLCDPSYNLETQIFHSHTTSNMERPESSLGSKCNRLLLTEEDAATLEIWKGHVVNMNENDSRSSDDDDDEEDESDDDFIEDGADIIV